MNDALRQWKRIGLERRIRLTRQALEKSRPASDQRFHLGTQYLRLIRQRNDLRTAEEIAQIERERRLSA